MLFYLWKKHRQRHTSKSKHAISDTRDDKAHSANGWVYYTHHNSRKWTAATNISQGAFIKV